MFAVAAVKLINSSPACVSGEKSFFLVLVLNTNISERIGRRKVNVIRLLSGLGPVGYHTLEGFGGEHYVHQESELNSSE